MLGPIGIPLLNYLRRRGINSFLQSRYSLRRKAPWDQAINLLGPIIFGVRKKPDLEWSFPYFSRDTLTLSLPVWSTYYVFRGKKCTPPWLFFTIKTIYKLPFGIKFKRMSNFSSSSKFVKKIKTILKVSLGIKLKIKSCKHYFILF